jgi:glutamate-1-semialdehyde 2,1-aminomutase
MNVTRSRELQTRFHSVIPGGSHTYAKGDDQYPEFMPVYLARGKGCHVWDVDGNEFDPWLEGRPVKPVFRRFN